MYETAVNRWQFFVVLFSIICYTNSILFVICLRTTLGHPFVEGSNKSSLLDDLSYFTESC